ncbi:MAG: M56 family metallopeptidase, partial [Ginsengibacter sp.]
MAVHFLNILNLTGLRLVFTTLAHSLWLGVIMAMLAGIIIILTSRSGSLLRYKLLTGLLMLFGVCIVYIFYNALTGNTKLLAGVDVTTLSDQAEIQQIQNIQQQKGLFNILLSFIETHADTIVLIWFIVICFKCIRLIAGLRAMHRLKKTNIVEAGTYWIERMNELAARIGIVKQIELLQSSLAKIPMVIGHLKPIILFPIGILNALPSDEVEAILLHELAHIRRNDFLINLLQQFAEIAFFFNPGVIWVSSLIKNERENCCDDIAIAVTHDKKIFIQALVAFQEYDAGLTYANTFPGSKNHLLNRVKRIITNNNKTLNNMEKLILASGIIITSLAALAFSPGHINIKKEALKTNHTITTAIVNNATVKETKFKGNTNAASPKFNFNK